MSFIDMDEMNQTVLSTTDFESTVTRDLKQRKIWGLRMATRKQCMSVFQEIWQNCLITTNFWQMYWKTDKHCPPYDFTESIRTIGSKCRHWSWFVRIQNEYTKGSEINTGSGLKKRTNNHEIRHERPNIHVRIVQHARTAQHARKAQHDSNNRDVS